MKKSNIKITSVLFLGFLLISLLSTSCKDGTKKKNNEKQIQPKLEQRTAKILDVDGLKFKDLNKNNQLDAYEDWRLTAEERSTDLVGKLSLVQKAGLMIIGTTRLKNEPSFGRGGNQDSISSDFNEKGMTSEVNFFTRKQLEVPMVFAAPTTEDVNKNFKRHFILRVNAPVDTLAKWANKLQMLCEGDDFGIPATIASNPRNHITSDASIGLSVGKTPFTAFPGELGLAAMRDLKLVREFADISRQEWRATGINKGYMYMADLATEPRWQRVEGTFGEDAKLAADVMREVVLGFQGDSLNATSVALTTKHFPGGGSAEGGQDPHFDWGKKEVYPGGMFENNLIPFKAAIDAGTSSIMPYYSYPADTEYEEVGFAFNKRILQDILRKQLGFQGIINSDTGPIEMMPWGVEKLSIHERYKKAIEAGINLFSGSSDPNLLIESLNKYPELMPLVDTSVHKILIEKFQLGIFENPYVHEAASKHIKKQKFQKRADLALRKSIVLLRNQESSLPLKPKTKVYFETYLKQRSGSPSTVFTSNNNQWDIEFVDSPDKADVNILWLIPKGKSLFESDGSPLHIDLSNNGIDVEYVNKVATKKPTILVVNYTNPWAIDEIYTDNSKNIKGVLATFGTTPEAVLDVVMGKFNPSGKMPFTTPISDDAAQNQKSDVPGYMEGDGYGLFNFDEGLNY